MANWIFAYEVVFSLILPQVAKKSNRENVAGCIIEALACNPGKDNEYARLLKIYLSFPGLPLRLAPFNKTDEPFHGWFEDR